MMEAMFYSVAQKNEAPFAARKKCLEGIYIYRRHIPKLARKNGFFCNREKPDLFIKISSLNIMDVMRHKRFGCSNVYDTDFFRQDESGGVGAKMDKFWMKAAAFGKKNGQNLDFSAEIA